MIRIMRSVAAVCAVATLAGSMTAVPATAEKVIRSQYYAMADMGTETAFNRVEIDWGGSVPDEYRVEYSDNGEEWTEPENNSAEKNAVSNFTFNDVSEKNCYGYKAYSARYVRVVSDEDLSKVKIGISNIEDIAPQGSEMRFEKNDGSDIKASSTEKIDERLNMKNIATSSYIYWGNTSDGAYDFDEANIIIPLGAEKEVSRFEIASFYNANAGGFTNYFPKNYEISCISGKSDVHADTEGWTSVAAGENKNGRLIAEFDKIKADCVKLTLSGKGVTGRNQSKLGSADDGNIEKIATFMSYIGIYTSSDVAATMTYGSFDAEVEVPADMGMVDLVMFMGQSNMAGRGTAAESIVCQSGHGYEFRAISDPTKLYDVKEPFGVNENNGASGVNEPGAKTGSMVSALMESYYLHTGVPMVGVSCSKGGTQIDFWQPGGAALNDAVERYNAAKSYLKKNGYTVRRKFMVWCQGESDGDAATPIDEYKAKTQAMAQAMIDEGIEKCFMVRIGHFRDNDKYDAYIEAQSQLCAEDDRFVMASEKFADMRDLMKDIFHYQQEAYNITGTDAGENIAKYYGDEEQIILPGTINIIDMLKTGTQAGVTIDSGFEGVIAAALYDADGRLEQSKLISDNTAVNTIKFNIMENSKTIKLFNWDSLSSMKPIGEMKNISIDSITVRNSATTDDFLYGSYEDTEKYEHAMPYRYILPVNYDSEKEYPVLMYLHGAGRRGNDNENQLNNPKALFERLLNEENIKRYPCILIAPQCPANEQWVDTPWGNGSYDISAIPVSDELSMAKDIILDFENRFSVDRNRIYIAGQSMGGYGTWDMIMRDPDMFAAAIPQCAAGDPSQAAALKNTAIWAHHGESDDTVPLSGSREMVAALKAAGSTNVRYTQYPNVGHEVQVEAFKEEDLLSWLFSKSLETNSDVKDDYTYLRINDKLIRSYPEPRPVKQGGKVYVPAGLTAAELGWSMENGTISDGTAALTLSAENSITADGAVMADVNALADTFGVFTELDDVSNTVTIKAETHQREGALKLEAAEANSQQAEYPAQHSIDGKTDTRWSAMTTDSMPENTIAFDLGERKAVSAVEIYFYSGDGREYDFDINVSDDGKTWKKVNTFTSGKKSGFERFEFDAVNARYVQYTGRGSTLTNGTKNVYNSFWEFEVYGSDELVPEPVDPAKPDYQPILSAEADARTEAKNNAAAAIDGDQSTRWSSSIGGTQKENTITFDLGESKCISNVEIDFYGTGRVYDFDINVSNDGIKWKKAGSFNSKGKTVNNEFETFAFEKPINTRYIQYVGRGSNNGTNIYNSFWEFRAYGMSTVDPDAENAPAARLAKITVTRDEENTTYDSIGLTWTCETADDLEEVKFYSVERVMDGVTEFKTDGEVSDTKYVDSGSAQRPQYGPYEIDYELKSDDGQYYIADQDQNKKPLSDGGKTTFIYEGYEGIPLVSGGEYGYIVKGYSAGGELVAQSDLTMLSTKKKEKTASIVFSGEPSTELTGYNMSVSAVTKMEQGEYGGVSGWHFVKDEPGNQQHLGLKLDDASGLVGAEEDKGYLVKITWADRFYNHAATARLNLQRTANESYNTDNYNDAKNYIRTISGSGGENNRWYTMEFAYYGRNNHSLTVDNALADIAFNGYFAGQYGRFYIKSVEVSEWNGPEERPFEINMPSMFTDDMILQRDKEINIWGRIDGLPKNEDGAYEPAEVTAVLYDENGIEAVRGTGVSQDTRMADWTLTLDKTVGYEPGKSYRLEIKASADGEESETTVINNIIFGDVYLCAGQSNMRYGPEYANWTDYNADLDAREFDNDNIRIISNENSAVSAYWETDTVGWRKANTETIRDLSFSATASYFGKHLYEGNGNVPIGLISSAVGGAGIETFLVNPVTDGNGNVLYTGNSNLYNRQTYPYTNGFNEGNGMGLAGIIWYQGEADANGAKMSMSTYTKAMEQMVIDYRDAFNDEELPFMYVQLAAFDNPSGEYAAMREAQFNYMIGKNTNYGKPVNVGMAVITDNTDNIKDIHPRNKSEVGRRLSLWARKLVYGQENVEYTGPIFADAVPAVLDGKNALTITFEEGSVMNGLELRDGELVGMKIAGEDKNFVAPDSYELSADQKSITVMSETVENPVYVQYGYYKLPTDASLFNADGLPASPFRNYE